MGCVFRYRNWDGWNPVCRECRFEAGNHLVEGACISFELRPLILPMRIAPTVDFSRPGKKVVWSSSRQGFRVP
ncbi:MAG: hypothetical protein R2861_12965 [Desulfobacterales bacterium]